MNSASVSLQGKTRLMPRRMTSAPASGLIWDWAVAVAIGSGLLGAWWLRSKTERGSALREGLVFGGQRGAALILDASRLRCDVFGRREQSRRPPRGLAQHRAELLGSLERQGPRVDAGALGDTLHLRERTEPAGPPRSEPAE